MSAENPRADELNRLAKDHWAHERAQEAADSAWAAFDLDKSPRTKVLLARVLDKLARTLKPERRDDYLKLLTDRDVEPDLISTAGWRLWLGDGPAAQASATADFAGLASALDRDVLALTLLRESPVYFLPAERLLTSLRRWLLLSGDWQKYPAIIAALKDQTRLNGGAWPFDASERAARARPENGGMVPAYLARPEQQPIDVAVPPGDPVTQKVAAQYETWPYPAWTRITVGEPRRLPDVIRGMNAAAEHIPAEADMLVAGCGTGRQAAYVARHFPDAAVTAIDVSQASLDYAERQCRALGIDNVRFLKLDLHDVGQLGQRFHAIHSAGVLHHLPDPERGFEVLADVLHPGGVMHLMVYSRLQRLTIAAARTLIADLLREPISDELLRRVRQRLLQQPEQSVAAHLTGSNDFGTLAGTHDLILHKHEDPFDVSRIEQALDRAGLRLLRFDMRSPAVAARYDAMFPDDPDHRDIKAWARFTKIDPAAISNHYRFWCCKES